LLGAEADVQVAGNPKAEDRDVHRRTSGLSAKHAYERAGGRSLAAYFRFALQWSRPLWQFPHFSSSPTNSPPISPTYSETFRVPLAGSCLEIVPVKVNRSIPCHTGRLEGALSNIDFHQGNLLCVTARVESGADLVPVEAGGVDVEDVRSVDHDLDAAVAMVLGVDVEFDFLFLREPLYRRCSTSPM